jgi:hypothetical protein
MSITGGKCILRQNFNLNGRLANFRNGKLFRKRMIAGAGMVVAASDRRRLTAGGDGSPRLLSIAASGRFDLCHRCRGVDGYSERSNVLTVV